MSLARDDFGYLSAIDALENSFLKTSQIEKKEYVKDISGPEVKESEINDVFEKNSASSSKEKENELERIQEEYNQLEEQNSQLDKIQSDLEQIDKIITNNEDEEDYEETEDIEKSKEKEQALNRISELMSGVREKQGQISEMQREIQQTVSSIVELNIGDNAELIEAEMEKAEELKQSIVDEIKERPETVKKLKIKNIDRNLILAMLSLRQ